MRSPYALLLVGVIAGIVRGQDAAPQRWLQTHYPNLQKVGVQAVLQDAAEAGILSPAEVMAIKREHRRLRGKNRSALPQWQRVDFPHVDVTLPTIRLDAAAEHETNDGWQYADKMLGESIASGDCIDLNDVDCWQFDSVGGFYSITVNAAGLASIADSILYVRNHKGDPVAFNDNAGLSLLSQIHVYLPAGTYYADVAGYNGTGGGAYDLVVESDPVQIVDLNAAPLATSATQAPMSLATHDVFRFEVLADSHVELVVDSLGGDTSLVVQRSDGVVYFSNDDSFVGGADAAADIDVPAGVYYVYVSDALGAAGTAFDISYSATAITIPDICAVGSMTGDLVGDESLRLARIDLASPQHVELVTTDGPINPVFDTVLSLLDRDLDFLCDVDDDDPFGVFDPTRGNYSRLAMSLPAGVYYAAVAPYTLAFGDMTLTATCTAYAPTGVAAFGPSPGLIQGFGDIATYLLDNHSQASTRVLGDDFFFGLLGPDGELMSCTQCAPFWPQAGEVLAGQCTVFIWDRYDFSSIMNTDLIPPLHEDLDVTTRSKEGDLIFLFAAFGNIGPAFNFGVGDRGGLCLPTGAFLITYDVQTAPPGGINTWPGLPLANGFLQLQSGDAHVPGGWNGGIPAPATWRNVLSR